MADLNSPDTEQLVAEWTEPAPTAPSRNVLPAFIGGTLLLTLIMAVAGYFLKDSTYYFAAVATVVGGTALAIQKHRPYQPLSISLTNVRVIVGKRGYLINELAGFWLSDEGVGTLVNLEPKKAAMFPISFRHPGTSQEAADVLSAILPQVEERRRSITDTINRYVKF